MKFTDLLKTYFAKYISEIFFISIILGLGYMAYTFWGKAKEQESKFTNLIGTEEKYKQLTAYTAQLESAYKNQTDLRAKEAAMFKEVMVKKDIQIKALSESIFQMDAKTLTQTGPDYKDPNGDYEVYELPLNGAGSPPIGYISLKKNGSVTKENYAFNIKVEVLQTVNQQTGKVEVYTKAFFIERGDSNSDLPGLQKQVWLGKEFPLNIVGGTAEIDPEVARTDPEKLQLWAPRLNGGFNVGADVGGAFIRPNMNLSLSGYGRSRNDLKWKFVGIGASADTKLSHFGLDLIPFTYRPLESILSNTYVGPGLGWTEKGINYFINTGVSF